MTDIWLENLGNIEYGKAWQIQEKLLKTGTDFKIKRNKDASLAQNTLKNYLLTCQHPHVYTLGKHGNKGNLLLNKSQLHEKHISFYETNRGGDITYHGPGQLVAYPILDLEQFFTDLRRYMHTLEEVVIRLLRAYGIEAGRLDNAIGVWLDPDIPGRQRKICAMGVRCSRWITLHGLALNINTELDYFKNIVPCGLTGKGVASMQSELGTKLDETEVHTVFLQKFAEVFDANILPGKGNFSAYQPT